MISLFDKHGRAEAYQRTVDQSDSVEPAVCH